MVKRCFQKILMLCGLKYVTKQAKILPTKAVFCGLQKPRYLKQLMVHRTSNPISCLNLHIIHFTIPSSSNNIKNKKDSVPKPWGRPSLITICEQYF
jgi:hypothetical protein